MSTSGSGISSSEFIILLIWFTRWFSTETSTTRISFMFRKSSLETKIKILLYTNVNLLVIIFR